MERIEITNATIEVMRDMAEYYSTFMCRDQKYYVSLAAAPYAYHKETGEMVYEENRYMEFNYEGTCLDCLVRDMLNDFYNLMTQSFMEQFNEEWLSCVSVSFDGDTFAYLEDGKVGIGINSEDNKSA